MEGVEYALRENEVLTANIITGMFNGLALILTAAHRMQFGEGYRSEEIGIVTTSERRCLGKLGLETFGNSLEGFDGFLQTSQLGTCSVTLSKCLVAFGYRSALCTLLLIELFANFVKLFPCRLAVVGQ